MNRNRQPENQLTVLVPCKNERKNIRACVASFHDLADEILIADSGSTDGTLDIVKSIDNIRIIERDYVNSGNFKNWAIPQATHSWVLVVDADERITPELAEEISSVLADPAEIVYDGFWVFRDNHFLGHPIRHSGWGTDKVIRLFRRDVSRYKEYTDHTEVDLPGALVGTLHNRMTHFTCWTYDEYFRKFHRYTEQQAQYWYEREKKPSLVKLVFTGPFRFFRAYFIDRGFLDGAAGFQVSMLTAFYSFMKQARLWQKLHAVPQPDGELDHARDTAA